MKRETRDSRAYAAGLKAGWIAGSGATLNKLYGGADSAMILWIGQVLSERPFTSTDPAKIAMRESLLARAREFEHRVLSPRQRPRRPNGGSKLIRRAKQPRDNIESGGGSVDDKATRSIPDL